MEKGKGGIERGKQEGREGGMKEGGIPRRRAKYNVHASYNDVGSGFQMA